MNPIYNSIDTSVTIDTTDIPKDLGREKFFVILDQIQGVER